MRHRRRESLLSDFLNDGLPTLGYEYRPPRPKFNQNLSSSSSSTSYGYPTYSDPSSSSCTSSEAPQHRRHSIHEDHRDGYGVGMERMVFALSGHDMSIESGGRNGRGGENGGARCDCAMCRARVGGNGGNAKGKKREVTENVLGWRSSMEVNSGASTSHHHLHSTLLSHRPPPYTYAVTHPQTHSPGESTYTPPYTPSPRPSLSLAPSSRSSPLTNPSLLSSVVQLSGSLVEPRAIAGPSAPYRRTSSIEIPRNLHIHSQNSSNTAPPKTRHTIDIPRSEVQSTLNLPTQSTSSSKEEKKKRRNSLGSANILGKLRSASMSVSSLSFYLPGVGGSGSSQGAQLAAGKTTRILLEETVVAPVTTEATAPTSISASPPTRVGRRSLTVSTTSTMDSAETGDVLSVECLPTADGSASVEGSLADGGGTGVARTAQNEKKPNLNMKLQSKSMAFSLKVRFRPAIQKLSNEVKNIKVWHWKRKSVSNDEEGCNGLASPSSRSPIPTSTLPALTAKPIRSDRRLSLDSPLSTALPVASSSSIRGRSGSSLRFAIDLDSDHERGRPSSPSPTSTIPLTPRSTSSDIPSPLSPSPVSSTSSPITPLDPGSLTSILSPSSLTPLPATTISPECSVQNQNPIRDPTERRRKHWSLPLPSLGLGLLLEEGEVAV